MTAGAYPTGGGPAVQVESAVALGNQSDTRTPLLLFLNHIMKMRYVHNQLSLCLFVLSSKDLAPVFPNRDGGAVGSVGGKILWFWSDTTYTSSGTFNAFYGNTGAVGNASNPLKVYGLKRQAIPFTATEQAFNSKYSNNPR
jgi:hypothetical protein